MAELRLLIAILFLDLLLGDPPYSGHPVRLIGRAIQYYERILRSLKWDGRTGGVFLVFLTAISFLFLFWTIGALLRGISPWLGDLWNLYWGFHLFALRDLIDHVHRIARAVRHCDLTEARYATSRLVGRDTEPMDGPACCRAGIESLAENLTDGVIAPLFWFLIGGIPAMLLFKVVSTLDSMVGYKNERYLYFGWAGARLDDLLNWIPARLTWLCVVTAAALLPGFSARKAWSVALKQHHLVPGPNSGWSEAAFAGALQRRLAGPIWKDGILVSTLWLGDPDDSPQTEAADIGRAVLLAIVSTAVFLLGGSATLLLF